MTSRRSPARWLAYGIFYRLPLPLRRRLVRLFVHKYTVGSVVLLRDSEADSPGRLLLLRQPPGRAWGLPAGLLQRREAPVAAAIRELGEETGIRLAPEQLRPAVPNAVVHLRGWVDIVFEASVPASTTPLRVDGAEVLEAGWHPMDELPPLTTAAARLLGHYGIGPLAERTVGAPPDAPAAETAGFDEKPRSELRP
ncbi:MAG TPA: NUDIX domain-containing protein [Micromonosporaceae bacterium]